MIRLRSLGQCLIEIGNARLAPDSEMLFATALYLVVEHGRPVRRSELMELLWPAAEEARAHHSLRQALYKLKSLGIRLATEHAAVMLAPRDVETDYAPFLREQSAAALEILCERATGECLPGYIPRISAPYAEWLDRHRDLVHSALRRALVTGIAAKKARADWAGVETLAKRCLRLDPLNEEATLAIAEAAAMHGSKAYALTVLDRYLKEIGPEAREIRLPATVLRRRIGEPGYGTAVPLGHGPFVGRADEMAMLHQSLALALDGHGSASLLWGEAGIGKSRLATEFTKGAALQHVHVIRVGCQSHDVRRSLSAFVDLVPKLLELRGAIGCSPDSMKYLKRMVEHDTSITTPSPDAREAELLFSNIRRALFDLIDAIAAEMTLVVVVEDVHWLDPRSWELLRDVVAWLATRRVLLILTSRESHVEDPPHHGRAIHELRRMHVGPLPHAASGELLDALLSHRPVDGEFRDWCLATSGGNPYYVSELAAHAVEEGGRYQVPVSLTALIAERLHRLTPISRRLLQACAVLGKNSTIERVETVLAQTRVELLDSLDDLERQGLIESDGVRLVIKHDLLGQAATEQLSNASRQLLHRHTAAALQAEGEQSQASALLWECAEHWNAAGEVERAIALLRSCAQHSLELGLPVDAARTLERAVGMTGEDEVLALWKEWLVALQLAGEWEKLLPVVRKVIAMQEAVEGKEHQHTDEELVLVEALWRDGRPLTELFDQLMRCARATDAPSAHRVRATTLAIMLADNLCCREKAGAAMKVVESCLDTPEVTDSARFFLQLVYHCSFGDHEIAVRASRGLVHRERRNGNAATLSRALRHASTVLHLAGYAGPAMNAAEEALHLAEAHDLHRDAIAATSRLIDMCLSKDDVTQALHWHAVATQEAAHSSDRIAQGVAAGMEAQLYLRCGQYTEAEAALRTCEVAFRNSECLLAKSAQRMLQAVLRVRRDGAIPTGEELNELRDLHLRTRSYNGQDYVMEAFHHILVASGRRAEADEVLGEYISGFRRDRSKLSPELDRLWQNRPSESNGKISAAGS
jgi:DNA-binding SARP family transcriptional activator